MVNVNQLDKDFKEILKGLTFEEIVTYYRSINKKLLETYPSSESMEWNVEEHNKLFESISDATDVFKRKYPSINTVKYLTKFEVLEDKYLDECNIAYYRRFYTSLLAIYILLGMKISNLNFFLNGIYNYLDFVNVCKSYLLEEELGLNPEEIGSLKTTSSYYGAEAQSYINIFIKAEIKVIEEHIEYFEDFRKIDYNPEDDLSEELLKVVNDYNTTYDSTVKLIEQYKELKANPFKEAIEESVQFRIDNSLYSEEDYDVILESKIDSAPSYDFKNYKIILPTGSA